VVIAISDCPCGAAVVLAFAKNHKGRQRAPVAVINSRGIKPLAIPAKIKQRGDTDKRRSRVNKKPLQKRETGRSRKRPVGKILDDEPAGLPCGRADVTRKKPKPRRWHRGLTRKTSR
jgi:hypothetical protein